MLPACSISLLSRFGHWSRWGNCRRSRGRREGYGCSIQPPSSASASTGRRKRPAVPDRAALRAPGTAAEAMMPPDPEGIRPAVFGLFPQHEALLHVSGITSAVAEARGYRTVDTKAMLARYGFSPAQRRVPGLLIPVWGVNGQQLFAQYRPDTPRTNADGKPVKYETPRNVRMVIDAHPMVRPQLADSSRPLFITEGLRKADAAVSRGLCCIALLGVWNWRGRNAYGGKTALSDWETVALNGRQIYLAFDSDVTRKPEVQQALKRLRGFLELRGGQVALIVFPEGPGGEKVGLDDYLAGHGVEDLLALATTDLPRASEERAFLSSVRGLTPLQVAELQDHAAPVLGADDPLTLFRESLVRCGYGGDTRPAETAYLAATTRVLAIRQGAMPAHLLLLGPPSAGKNWTINLTLRHLPSNTYVIFDAGSPRVLIYDDADLRHRVVVFGEADSLPAGEDNPAASAVRNLLQDHHLHYKVTVREPKTGQFVVRTIDKPGPSVLFTTAVRRLGPQLESRMFALEIPDDPQQVQAALRTQAALELEGAADPPRALVAFQEYLQARAPWEVVVPFAGMVAERIGRSATAPRILRDFARLLALVKATAVLRHAHRQRDAEGRLMAEVEDYATVHGLVADLYTASTTGAGRKVRETVTAVAALKAGGADTISVTAVAQYLEISKQAASGRVGTALQGGWIINREERSGRPYRLDVGDPLPAESGLPSPLEVGCQGVNPLTGGKKEVEIEEAVV